MKPKSSWTNSFMHVCWLENGWPRPKWHASPMRQQHILEFVSELMPGAKVEKLSSVHNASHFVFLVWLNAGWKTRSSGKFLCKCSTSRITTEPAKLGSALWPRALNGSLYPPLKSRRLCSVFLGFCVVRKIQCNILLNMAWENRFAFFEREGALWTWHWHANAT